MRTLAIVSISLFSLAVDSATAAGASPRGGSGPKFLGDYVVLGWNDLGMHCMNRSYDTLCVLPPFNNLWAQVIHRGNPPELISSGVRLSYSFPANTASANKVNFWVHAQSLFGANLAPNIGLTGNGLTGALEWNGAAFEARGVPLTPFDDATPTVEQPYQLVEVALTTDSTPTVALDQTSFVAPVSTEMHCDTCHSGGGGSVENNILAKHDEEEGTNLLGSKPVLCASCHSSNALGTAGQPGIPSLSRAMHGKHAEEIARDNCYGCHPGTKTQCFRDAMYIAGKHCADCHGDLRQVATSISQGRRPWLDEPRCATCHPQHAENPGTLYRNSTGHGGLYCAACHNSPHAILPTVQTRDAVQVLRVQGSASYIRDCAVCHIGTPQGPGPHGLMPPQNSVRSGWSIYN